MLRLFSFWGVLLILFFGFMQAHSEGLLEEKLQQKQMRATHGLRGNTPRANEIMRDNSRWEASLLERSGVTHREGAMDDMEEEEERVRLIVKDLRPPFLDGRVVFSTQTEQVSVVCYVSCFFFVGRS